MHTVGGARILRQPMLAAERDQAFTDVEHGRGVSPHHMDRAGEPQRMADAGQMRQIIGKIESLPKARPPRSG